MPHLPPRTTEQLAALVSELCAFNSYTFNPAGIVRAGQIATRELELLGGHVIRTAVDPALVVSRAGTLEPRPLAPAFTCVFNPDAPARVLLNIHLDTVYPPTQSDPAPVVRRDGDRLVGQGVVDAKGGVVVLLEALRRFLSQTASTRLGIEVLFNPDEEIGSPGSLPLLQAAARRTSAALVCEPAFPDGNLISSRKGSGTYTLVVRGRSAHAGRDLAMGRNALLAAAEIALRIEALSVAGATFNVGTFDSGAAANVVPDLAILRINVRASDAAAIPLLEAALRTATTSSRDGITTELHGQLTSPPRPCTAATLALLELTRSLAAPLGLNLSWRETGGACDGNKLAAAGLSAVLDSLGPVGGELHSPGEYVLISSLEPRASLLASLLTALAEAPELLGLRQPP